MKFNHEYVKAYVYYFADKYISLNLLKQLIGAFSFISLFPLACVFLGKALIWSISLIAITVLYATGVFVFQNNANGINSFSIRFLVNGIVSVIISIYFLFLSYTFLSLRDYPVVAYIIILIGFFLIYAIINIYTVIKIKKGKYLHKSIKAQKRRNIVLWSTIGSLIGINLSRILLNNLNDDELFSVIVFLVCIASYLCLFGTTNFLKYYYTKNLMLICDESGNNASPLLLHQKNTSSKNGLVIIIALVILLAFFAVVGIITNP